MAIADVSHYVGIDSALDREAKLRGNSVYFPNRVVPMLPEALSNGLCSLKPQVDRLCMVCEMTIGAAGKLTGYRFFEGVMHSRARLTYTKVAAMLDAQQFVARIQLAEQPQPFGGRQNREVRMAVVVAGNLVIGDRSDSIDAGECLPERFQRKMLEHVGAGNQIAAQG